MMLKLLRQSDLQLKELNPDLDLLCQNSRLQQRVITTLLHFVLLEDGSEEEGEDANANGDYDEDYESEYSEDEGEDEGAEKGKSKDKKSIKGATGDSVENVDGGSLSEDSAE
jgi:hypothetical protein